MRKRWRVIDIFVINCDEITEKWYYFDITIR
jgi:hypothetical protein